MRARPLIFTGIIALWTPAVGAQPAPGTAVPQAATDEADRLFREANKLYNEKKHAEAEAVYERAFAQKRAHDIAANLGYAELKQGKLVEAAEHIAYAVRAWPPTGSVTATAAPTSVPPPASHPRMEIVVGGAALSGAAIVVGAVLVGMAEKTRADLRAESPRNPDGSFVCAAQTAPGTAVPICDDMRARAREASSFGQAGIGLLVGGGLVGLVTAGYALFWPRSQRAAATTVTPVVTHTQAGLVWSGSF